MPKNRRYDRNPQASRAERRKDDAREPKRRTGVRTGSSSRQRERQVDRSIADEIQEQLCRQRQQQHEKEQQSETTSHVSSSDAKPKRLGQYVYDEERQAYFPQDSFPRPNTQQQRKKMGQQSSSVVSFPPVRNRSFPFLPSFCQTIGPINVPDLHRMPLYHAQVCNSPRQRHALVSEWACRTAFQRMAMQKWSQHDVMMTDSPGLPTWCRTFDVVQRHFGNKEIPSFLNLMGGMALLDSYLYAVSRGGLSSNQFPVGNDYYSVRFLLENPTGRGRFAVAMERATEPDTKTYLIGICVETSGLWVRALPVEVNDVAQIPSNKMIVLATNVDDDYHGRPWMNGNVCSDNNFPTSDSLCMDVLHSDVCLFGHRNGQVTVFDPCRDQNCTSTLKKTRHQSLGNVTGLYSLEGGNQFLARGSSGFCRLFDVRKMGAATAAGWDPSVVHDLEVPDSGRNPWTQKCRGVVVDPSGTMVLAPWVSRDESSSLFKPLLGAWCVQTGRYLGSKPAIGEQSLGTWLELCPTLTDGWDPDSIPITQDTRACETTRARRIAGSRGFWVRSWNPSESHMMFVDLQGLVKTNQPES